MTSTSLSLTSWDASEQNSTTDTGTKARKHAWGTASALCVIWSIQIGITTAAIVLIAYALQRFNNWVANNPSLLYGDVEGAASTILPELVHREHRIVPISEVLMLIIYTTILALNLVEIFLFSAHKLTPLAYLLSTLLKVALTLTLCGLGIGGALVNRAAHFWIWVPLFLLPVLLVSLGHASKMFRRQRGGPQSYEATILTADLGPRDGGSNGDLEMTITSPGGPPEYINTCDLYHPGLRPRPELGAADRGACEGQTFEAPLFITDATMRRGLVGLAQASQ